MRQHCTKTASIKDAIACSNYGDGLGKKAEYGKLQRKGAPKAKGVSAAGACKSTKKVTLITTPVTKRREKNSETNPLFIDPPDDAYVPYFKEFEGKRAPTLPLWKTWFCASHTLPCLKILLWGATIKPKPYGGNI